MSNRDFPAPYRPGRGPEGLPGQGSSFPYRPGSRAGYASASQTGRRVLGGLGYGRGRSGGQHSRSSRGTLWGGGRDGVREDSYAPRRAAPGPGGRSSRSGAQNGGTGSSGRRSAAQGRTTARFGTGVRDIRDDLRERLRRNGVRGAWGEPGGGQPARRGGRGGDDWDGPGGPRGRKPRRKGSWWRHWSWKKVLTLAAALFGVFLIVVAAGIAYAYSKTPIPNPQASVTYQASKVYFSDGKTEVGQFGTANRVILT